MHTYQVQETERTGKHNAEMTLGIVVLVLLILCGLANMPMPTRPANNDPWIGLRQDKVRAAQIQELRTRDGALEGEMKKVTKALENAKADLASFRQVHDALIAQVATATAKLQHLEGRVQEVPVVAQPVVAEPSPEEVSAMDQLKRERDEALEQARVAAERVRELTLKLQRAGVYP